MPCRHFGHGEFVGEIEVFLGPPLFEQRKEVGEGWVGRHWPECTAVVGRLLVFIRSTG